MQGTGQAMDKEPAVRISMLLATRLNLMLGWTRYLVTSHTLYRAHKSTVALGILLFLILYK